MQLSSNFSSGVLVVQLLAHGVFFTSASDPCSIPAGQDRTRHDRTGQDRAGHDRTGQDRTGQDRTGQDRIG